MKKLLALFIFPLLGLGQTPCLDAVESATGLVGEFIPQCEEDGSYSPMQCWWSTGYCWCVDENGAEIEGTSMAAWEGMPNCDKNTQIKEFSSNKTLLRVIDILGREPNRINRNTTLLYIFDNGSVEKKHILKSL